MAIARVFGRIDGKEVTLTQSQDEIWTVQVPADQDGEYAVEIMVEDEAGNQSFLARMLYTIRAGSVCVHALPLTGWLFERRMPDYEFSLLPKRFFTMQIQEDRIQMAAKPSSWIFRQIYPNRSCEEAAV